jgi:UDP-N-acetylglucosamine--N-acetylmuramyl-(pentapeptide) pyrophosphoryl-undecaprenol N-acetylglucosamine transferase
LRIPSVLWEGNVIPGKSARFVARLATAVAVSHPATVAGLGIGTERAFVTGTPIRRVDTVDREAARDRFGIPPGDRVLLVFGGSQAVKRFNAAVAEALPQLVVRVHVIHVTGESGYAAALAQKGSLPEAVRGRYQPFPFLRDEMTDALAAADLAVGRAGASTLAEAAAFGLPLAIVPYPHASGHQLANATAHIDAGAGVLVRDEAFDATALLRTADILADPTKHAQMSAAARALARPGAADAVADLVLAAAERRAFPDQAAIDARARGAAG